MTSLISPPPAAEEAVMKDVASALHRRLSMFAEEDDHTVLVGMVAAGKTDPSVLERLDAAELALSSSAVLTELGIPTDQFSRFRKLWYHFKVPHGQASLLWWYVFCLALGGQDDVGHALQTMTEDLGALERSQGAGVPDLSSRGSWSTVQSRLDALRSALEAARTAQHPQNAATGTEDTPQGLAHHALWAGDPVQLHAVTARVRQRWEALSDQERDELLAQLEQRITSVEQIRLLLGETLVKNRDAAAVLATCRAEPVADWPHDRLVLATYLWCWHLGGYIVQELNQSFVSLPALALFLTRRTREYGRQLSLDGHGEDLAAVDPTADPTLLAEALGRVREKVERQYERCLHFDGSNWERREFLIPLTAMRRSHAIPENLRALIHERTGAELRGDFGAPQDWDACVDSALAAGSSPTGVMLALSQWAVDAEDLPIDIAVFTVPLGRKMAEPWTFDFTDLFCYSAFRTGFSPEDYGIKNNLVGIQNVMGQRMRYNAVKKAQNYAPVRRFPPQGFNLPDISVAEDANHAGHTAAGVRLACRVPIAIDHGGRTWHGLADVRLNRASYHSDNRFAPRDIVTANRYGQWAKAIAEAAYRRGLVFDEKWGNKVKDLEL